MEKFILTKKEIENAKEKSSCVKEMLDLLNVKYGTLYAQIGRASCRERV